MLFNLLSNFKTVQKQYFLKAGCKKKMEKTFLLLLVIQGIVICAFLTITV